jgi:hypothetical protein
MNDCIICIEPLKKNKSKELNCKHTFHIECIQKWYDVQQTCPICRTVIDPNEIDIDEPYYIEIMSNYTTLPLPSTYQTQTTNMNQNNNYTNTNTNTNSICIIKKNLVIILNIFIVLGIVGSFTANIFCQNNFINEIKKYIEYTNNNMNDSNNTDTAIYYNNTFNDNDYNNSIIDYNNTDNAYYNIDNNSNSNVTIIDNEPGNDMFYILFAIAYMFCMLILTYNYISIKTMESNSNLINNYIGFYIITIIMFCTHLYYLADIFSYMNEYKYPNIKEYGDIEELYHTYLITSMTSLSILIFSFLVKIKENLRISFNCCYNMFIYCLLCCKC